LFVTAGNFGGSITGSLTLEVPFGALTLTSINNTYTGGTTIDADGTLRLGDGGTTGSVSGNITDNGTLLFRHSGTFLEAGAISGSGNVVQSGPGTTVLTASNTYSGGTFLAGGTLEAPDTRGDRQRRGDLPRRRTGNAADRRHDDAGEYDPQLRSRRHDRSRQYRGRCLELRGLRADPAAWRLYRSDA
jgi:autotransporter-associated beta strand protein